MNDLLIVSYDKSEKDIPVMNIMRDDTVICEFHGDTAVALHRLLTGEPKAIQAARFGLLLDIRE